MSSETVDELRQRPGNLLIDARGAERFAGRNETIDPVAGHVPGARNHPFLDNLGADGRFLPADVLRQRFDDAARLAAAICADRDVRLGRHRLPQPARARTRGLSRRASVCRLLERVDPRSATAGRHGRVLEARTNWRLLANPICYRARQRGSRTQSPVRDAEAIARRSERPIAWSVDDSAELYQVNAWGKGYFCVNPAGHLVVRPDMNAEREIDLFDVVQGLKERELTTPVVVRFSDILAHRLKHLHDAFAQAIAENDYQNRYTAVFPIKVNQQRLVVEEVYRYGKPFGFGLEVGSKPELLSRDGA